MGESPRLAIVLAGARVYCLGMLALFLNLPCDSSVGAATFAFNGFQMNSLYFVPDSRWLFDNATGCIRFDSEFYLFYNASGRSLYPDAVQMIDPRSTTVKSFSTSFIFQLRIRTDDGYTGPGMAFIIVPDNATIGAPGDSMGLITIGTSDIAKNYESDDHTFGVELDTYKNPEFDDINNNHIGINLASMNSTYSFEPVYSLSSSTLFLYRQIWIDYDAADSRMDIYFANYKQQKPAKPQGSQSGLNMSLLKEEMFLGFSMGSKAANVDAPSVCAWSFSNDGTLAPSIVIAKDATPDAPVVAPSLPPPAPSLPPLTSVPPLNPSPPPSIVPPPSPNSKPPTIAKKGGKKKNLAGIYVGVSIFLGLCLFVFCSWLRFLSHPLRIFISHAGGSDGSEKNFPTFLHNRMMRYTWSTSKLNIKFFFDKENIDYGKPFATKIFDELARFDVGLVVVTEAFFKGKWPMIELIAFVEAHTNDPTGRLQILPLFYKLTPGTVKEHLRKKTWESDWEEMSIDNHPLEVEKCRHAVNLLCSSRGILYRSEKRDYDKEYIEEICKGLDKILRKERSFTSYICRASLHPFCIPSECRLEMTRNPRK